MSMSTTTVLPPEMIYDVLSRLPVKSLLRFRCTSKPVCSIIDGPDFIKLHLTNSKQSLVLANRSLQFFSVYLPSLERAVEIDHPLETLRADTKVLGSCNGLLCLIDSDSEAEIVLWNMSTRNHHRLPYIHTVFPNQGHINHHQASYGFGYDSVHDDYKLVRIVRFLSSSDSEVMVYSLKSNSWRKKVGGFPYDLLYMRSMALFTNSAVHLLLGHPKEDHGVIVAFDLPTEDFREVSLPPGVGSKYSCELLWVIETHLGEVTNHMGKGAEIWALKHNESSWAKLLSIADPRLIFPHCLVPEACFNNGNELLLLLDGSKLLRYDLKTKKMENARIHGMPPSFDATPYVDSLVKPFPTVSQSNGQTQSNCAEAQDQEERPQIGMVSYQKGSS